MSFLSSWWKLPAAISLGKMPDRDRMTLISSGEQFIILQVIVQIYHQKEMSFMISPEYLSWISLIWNERYILQLWIK